MVNPAVAFRFFAFNLHDPRVLGRLLTIFVRGLLVAVGAVMVVGLIVVGGTWLVSNLNQVRRRLAGTVKRPGPS
jgi:hypothetical protein